MTLDCVLLLRTAKGHFSVFLVSNINGYLSFLQVQGSDDRSASHLIRLQPFFLLRA